MKQRIPLRQLIFLAVCVVLSLVSKRVISPVTNLLTDLIRIPGGGAATAFSLMFLLVGTAGLSWRWAATAAAFVQSLIALSLGMSSYQGAFAVLTYTLPGLVMDLCRMVWHNRDGAFFPLSCCMANSAGALLTNLLIFRLEGLAFALWLLVASSMGAAAGLLGETLYGKLILIPEYRRIFSCQEKQKF